MSYVNSRVRVDVAIIAGHSSEMDEAARNVLRSVRRAALPHAKTGHYMDSLKIVTVPGEIGTGRLVSDRLVVADDPGAASIEFGHFTKITVTDGATSRTDHAGGRRRVTTGRWVAGQHVMARGLAGV